MTEPYLVDNDIVLKISAFNLYDDLLHILAECGSSLAMLGVGKHVVRKRARKSGVFRDPDAVLSALEQAIQSTDLIEPTDAEIDLAAELEQLALERGLALDVGEAQLISVLVTRSNPGILTGDKRAIIAAEGLDIEGISGRLICLEQVILRILGNLSVADLRARVCREETTDKTMSICFSCTRVNEQELSHETVIEALNSYIANVRQSSSTVLFRTKEL